MIFKHKKTTRIMKLSRLPTIAALFGLTVSSFAQQSYDVQLVLKKIDCMATQAEVEVQVRTSADRPFDMGDANYRFEYDPLSIRNPKIVSQDNFSNQAVQRNLNYAPQNLQGSRELADKGIVSLNTFFTGSNAGTQQVSKNWISVATLRFDIIDMRKAYDLKWHDDKTFPISGMSCVQVTEKNDVAFEYNLNTVDASGYFGNLRIDPTVHCKNATPSVEAMPIHVPKNKMVEVGFPINDADVVDDHTVTVLTVGHGTLIPSVNNRQILLNYTPKIDFVGQDEAILEVKDRFNNVEKVTVKITVREKALTVFNGFSPNNDGVNDFLTIEGIEKFPNNTVSVFDVYGRELHQSIGYKNNWDGKSDGKMLLEGTYYYVIEDGEGETYMGYIQIKY
jgi:gliding motility-associated-like protein